jgi:hypothetical protein
MSDAWERRRKDVTEIYNVTEQLGGLAKIRDNEKARALLSNLSFAELQDRIVYADQLRDEVYEGYDRRVKVLAEKEAIFRSMLTEAKKQVAFSEAFDASKAREHKAGKRPRGVLADAERQIMSDLQRVFKFPAQSSTLWQPHVTDLAGFEDQYLMGSSYEPAGYTIEDVYHRVVYLTQRRNGQRQHCRRVESG